MQKHSSHPKSNAPERKEISLDSAIKNLEARTSADRSNLKMEVRSLSNDELSLEARLERALPPEMLNRLRKALQVVRK